MRKLLLSFVLRLLLPFVALVAQPVVADRAAQHVHHQMGGWSGDIQLYQAGLLNLMLKLSEPEFGPYTLELDSRILTGNRWTKAMRKGALHTSFRAGAPSAGENTEDIFWYLQPHLKSMLGLRRLLIRSEDAPRFALVKNIEDLRQLSIGQGDSWPDRLVYQNAGINVVEGKSIEHLVPMLHKKRFDYLALSVLEIEGIFAEYLTHYPNLVVAEDIYIFYPIPVYLTVSKMKPYIAARLRKGMERLYEDNNGKRLDDIFSQYFPSESRVFRGPHTRLFALENPSISPEIATSLTRHFHEQVWVNPAP